MRVALFGGSFNPPHLGHQLVGLYVLETQPVDELWIVPCFVHPFDKALAPFADRYAMCEAAARALGPRARVSDIEAQLGGESRTFNTVKALKERHPGIAITLIVGADLAREVDTWYHAEELKQLVSFLVVGRAGHSDDASLAMPNVSSTEVRARLARGEPVDALVPRPVLAYIRDHGLYGAAS